MVSISGNAHMAILSQPEDAVDIRSDQLMGDRSGVMHIGRGQTFGYTAVDTYLPVNIMAYK